MAVSTCAGWLRLAWTEAPLAERKAYIEMQLEYLESPVHEVRRAAQSRLMYLLQGKKGLDALTKGAFAESTSAEHQLHWVIENAKAIRAVDGVPILVTGLRDASRRYNASM
jgi:hypothetical protein